MPSSLVAVLAFYTAVLLSGAAAEPSSTHSCRTWAQATGKRDCTAIELSRVPPAPGLWDALTESIGRNHYSLRSLTLTSLSIDDGMATDMLGALLSRPGPPSLVRLDLRGNQLGLEAADAVKRLLQSTPLEYLNVAGNDALGDAGIQIIVDAINGSPTMRVLNIGKSGLSPTGVCSITATAGMNKLAQLYLFENNVGDVGAKCISDLISNSPSLRMLNLYECGLSDAGMVDIAGALSQTHTLAAVHLAGNQIGDDGAAALSRAIAEDPPSLGFVSLARNLIRDAGLNILSEAMEHNFHLQTLNMEGNKGTKAGAAVYKIERLAEANILRAKDLNAAKKSDAGEL